MEFRLVMCAKVAMVHRASSSQACLEQPLSTPTVCRRQESRLPGSLWAATGRRRAAMGSLQVPMGSSRCSLPSLLCQGCRAPASRWALEPPQTSMLCSA